MNLSLAGSPLICFAAAREARECTLWFERTIPEPQVWGDLTPARRR